MRLKDPQVPRWTVQVAMQSQAAGESNSVTLKRIAAAGRKQQANLTACNARSKRKNKRNMQAESRRRNRAK